MIEKIVELGADPQITSLRAKYASLFHLYLLKHGEGVDWNVLDCLKKVGLDINV